jgi:hypothetical protein
MQILKSDNDTDIQVEGIIEDIDVLEKDKVTAIQCKYHEAQEAYSLSLIYKPVLQMLKTYVQLYKDNPESDIMFILYAYFPALQEGKKELTVENLEQILNTENIDYLCNYVSYIKNVEDDTVLELISKRTKTTEDKAAIKRYFSENKLAIKCDLNDFLANHFIFEIGKPYIDLESDVKNLLITEGFSTEDVRDLFYPNAIQKIAEISIIKNDNDRIIKRQQIVDELRETKSTAITRWTKELENYKDFLKAKRKQLYTNLNTNYRKRCFVIQASELDDFEDEIVMFIKDFTSKYCTKAKLHIPPIFCIQDYDYDKTNQLISRLFAKGIKVENGYKGSTFFKEAFTRDPERKISEGWMEFAAKICYGMPEIYEIFNQSRPDDLFIVANDMPKEISSEDVNLELINIKNFSDLKYLLKLSEVI